MWRGRDQLACADALGYSVQEVVRDVVMGFPTFYGAFAGRPRLTICCARDAAQRIAQIRREYETTVRSLRPRQSVPAALPSNFVRFPTRRAG